MPHPVNGSDAISSRKYQRNHKKTQENSAKSNTPSVPIVNTPPQNVVDNFTGDDFSQLAVNEHNRYRHNSKKVGVVAIDEAAKNALQWKIPFKANDDLVVRPLENVEVIYPFGMERYKANTPEGTPMFSSRQIDMEYGKNAEGMSVQKMKIAPFSPAPPNKKEPFWGSKKEIPFFRLDLPEEDKMELDQELNEIKPRIKGGTETIIHPPSVTKREEMTRNPDQNKVMSGSAKDTYKDFLEAWDDEEDEFRPLHPDFVFILKRAITAPLDGSNEGDARPEWMHLKGFSLTPLSEDPQVIENLAAGPKWANTQMMVLERIAKWVALNRPETLIKIKPVFEMLLDSEIAKRFHFEVTLEEKNRFVKLIQDMDPFKKFPIPSKATDLALSTAIVNNLLIGQPPISEQKVKGKFVLQSVSNQVAPIIQQQPMSNPVMHQQVISNKTVPLIFPIDDDSESLPLSLEDEEKPVKKKQKKMGHAERNLKYTGSLVQVFTTFKEVDYEKPWSGVDERKCSGTGFVIEHEGKKYILTNAHCVENHLMVRVRLANHRDKKYVVKPLCISYQCDLALLEITDPELYEKAVPVELGEMVKKQQRVQVVGFPMGGDEDCITEGSVSRIEVGSYDSTGAGPMLQVQVSAPINHGNSGGPVFSNNKVVGVAFQGYTFAQNIGYIIPTPIIKHFLKDFRGFPVLPIEVQSIENDTWREYYGMQPNQTGVRVSQTLFMKTDDGYGKLKRDDILLEIDGFPISNEGTIDKIPKIGKCIDWVYLTHRKFIGDSVNVKVLRKDEMTGAVNIHDISMKLEHIPHETSKIQAEERDKEPTYYANAGMIFMPVTQNYIDQNYTKFEELFLAEENCKFVDAPRQSLNEQPVVLHKILDCEETHGYKPFEGEMISEVNGKKIQNITDIVEAMESNQNSVHCIVTGGKDCIVVKNMAAAENKAVLKRRHIAKDRSDDLRIWKKMRDLPANQQGVDMNASILSDNDSDDDSMDVDIQNVSMPTQWPGLAKYNAKIDNMFAFYSQHPIGDDDDESDDEDYVLDSADEESPNASEAEEASDNEMDVNNDHRNQRVLSQGPSLYNRRRTHAIMASDEDEAVINKKRRMG